MSEPTFSKLSAYISKMRMSHIYQPVMIRELLLRGGEASVEQIAAALLAHDRSQLEYYELRTKNMVGRVLANNGITEVRRNSRAITGYALIGAESVSPDERRDLVEACDEAIDAFLAKRSDQVWSHRSSSAGYIPGTLRY
jgi:ATP adenylyltransferase